MVRRLLWFFLISGVIASQFYVFSSGLPQPSHILLAIFSILFMVSCFLSNANLLVGANLSLYKFLFLFLGYVAFVNLVYSIISQNVAYNVFTIYLIYNIILFCCVCGMLLRWAAAKNILMLAIWVSVIVLFLVWLLGFGRFNMPPRYNGYFNDPNQMAFWLLCLLSSFLFLSGKKLVSKILLFGICAVLVVATMSRSALVGLTIIFVGLALMFAQPDAGTSLRGRVNRRILGSVFAAGFAGLVFYSAVTSDGFMTIYERFISTDFGGQADVRGYTRILEYPEYLILGAGQAEDIRFGALLEIHSTWAGIFFYYGFIGLLLFTLFLYHIAKHLSWSQLAVFLGPLLYSMSTFGVRTPVFWIFLACAFYAAHIKKREVSPDEVSKSRSA